MEDESPTPRLRQLSSPPRPAAGQSTSPATRTHQRNQLSRASSLLDPELNGSIDALNSLIVSEKAASRLIDSHASLPEQGSNNRSNDSLQTTPQATTTDHFSPQLLSDGFASLARGQLSSPQGRNSPSSNSPGAVHDATFVDDFRAKVRHRILTCAWIGSPMLTSRLLARSMPPTVC